MLLNEVPEILISEKQIRQRTRELGQAYMRLEGGYCLPGRPDA